MENRTIDDLNRLLS